MNPPSALQGAMGRERKPFTYTPGGLDLSEIKSERMAKRLMRNAMNQGVPEQPPQPAQSPSTPTTPIAVPNFNCLPVQVFPTFNLPANPKSLLRTRSTPDKPKEPPAPRVPPPTHNTNNAKPSGMEQIRETLNNSLFSSVNNDNNLNNNWPVQTVPSHELNNNYNRPLSMYEYNAPPAFGANVASTNYGSNAYTEPIMPEICYDAEYCCAAPKNSNCTERITFEVPPTKVPEPVLLKDKNVDVHETKKNTEALTDIAIKPISETIFVPIETVASGDSKPVEDIMVTDDDDDQTVKVVKKQVKKKVESEAQNQNGDQNGEAEAEMTVVKLPAKKSAAKTETKVEVVKKTLPDGSIEETKTTITKTTVDGKTNITTKTETTIIPKDDEEEAEEVEEEEEEEEESGDLVVQEVEENGTQEAEEPTTVVIKKTVTLEAPTVKETVVKKEEKSETMTTKKVVVQAKEESEEEEEVEEEEAEAEATVVVVKTSEQKTEKQQVKEEVKEVVKEEKVENKEEKVEEKQAVQEEEEEEEEEEEVEETVAKTEKVETKEEPPKKEEPEAEEEVEEEEEEYEEAEEPEEKPEPKPEFKPEPKEEIPAEPTKDAKEEKEEDEESEYTEEEIESEKEEAPKQTATPAPVSAPAPAAEPASEPVPAQPQGEPEKIETQPEEKKETPKEESKPQTEHKIPLREPSIPLEKVEDVEIKPIGTTSETISKTHSERTEILSSLPDRPAGSLSTQTEYNRIENIVTVNRTTKTLDHSYEQMTQQGIPTVKTYFAPGRERVSPTPQPARPYQPVYPTPTQPQPERRHSLLLERLSTERQMPSDIYQKSYQQQQYSNQAYDQQRQWSQEPQSEVVNDSNVKPSSITNQQWYQQSRKENVIFNNVAPSTPAAPSQQWSQPQPQVQLQPQYQTSYTENTLHDSSKITSNTYQQNSYPSYTPAPAPAPTPAPTNWVSHNVGSTLSNVNNTQSNQYSFLNKSSSENYQNTTQQYSSSYVPPPWEQDPTYVAPQLETQSYYQPQPATNTFSPSAQPGWNPPPPAPAGKFSKPVSKAYIPPAPNQSFVKTNTVPEPLKRPGSKTYYSEYERRYITVPESTYIPADAKFQPQPDPSPQYYYDNNEQAEPVEPQWRKELREFTEKTQTQTQTHQSQTQTQTQTQTHQLQQTEQTSVHPPWEEDPKYSKVPTVAYTPTPSWSQTLRPQSWRERSFESEYVGSNEWSKTNTLGRSRPVSSYGSSGVEAVPERARGVSVDRYTPGKYAAPMTIPYDSEHGPVQAHTLDPNPAAHRAHHNPNVPAYHARASAEPREQQTTGIPARNWGDSRTTPIQSRSFKYLQWITGTED